MNRLAYGCFGMPLALAALPVYVVVPALYADKFGLSLALIGAVLLAARAADAFLDPLIGWWIDRQGGTAGFVKALIIGSPLLAAGFAALFLPPAALGSAALIWLVIALLLTYAGFSLATIAHQGWGAALTQAPGERTRLVAVREAFALGGVLIAAGLLQVGGTLWLTLIFSALLAVCLAVLLRRAPRPSPPSSLPPLSLSADASHGWRMFLLPFDGLHFRWLFGVFMVNGIAAAIPATLFLFFARDALGLGEQSGAYLLLYFCAAALSLPVWTMLARRIGEARAWLLGMLLSVVSFIGAYWLVPGAAFEFGVICFLSGLALGADLAMPPALLAAVIGQAGHVGQREGVYFGAWNWASKINLALAAGIALPLLGQLGYTPGIQHAEGTEALRVAYALLPCALKLFAAVLLWRAPLRHL